MKPSAGRRLIMLGFTIDILSSIPLLIGIWKSDSSLMWAAVALSVIGLIAVSIGKFKELYPTISGRPRR